MTAQHLHTAATARLADLVQHKHACLRELRSLGEQQDAWIAAGDFDRLFALLAVKEQLLERLQQIERALDPYREEDPETRCWESPEARRHTAALAAECDELLRQILLHERASETLLAAYRDRAAAMLVAAHERGQARHAYTSHASAPCTELDLSSPP